MAIKQKNPKKSSQNVKLAHDGSSKLRHFRLVHHRHTGKLLHHRHTSHLALTCLLAVIGAAIVMFQFAIQQNAQALPPPVSHDVNISALVPGPPPTTGATITLPVDGTELPYEPTTQVGGTCAVDTVVVVSSNNSIVGSSACTAAGTFNLLVQLSPGQNILTAKNYDFMDQAGPDTPSVTITLTVPVTETPSEPGEESVLLVQPTQPELPNNPYMAPSINTQPLLCDEYDPPEVTIGGAPRVSVVCIPRSVQQNVGYTLGVLVWGGTPPYALDIDWGDGSTEHGLVSLASAGYVKIPFRYASAGNFAISIKLKDKSGAAAYVQAAVMVSGESKSFIAGINEAITRIQWFETPVPVYLLAVALTLGFWGGDLFDRHFGITKHRRKTHRST